MSYKGEGIADEWEQIDRFEDGVGWQAYPDEPMQRTSHALTNGDEIWLVDPVDAVGIDDFFAEHGTVAGVVVQVDRHTRDAAAIARRHDVAVHLPSPLDATTVDVDAPTRPFRGELGDTGYEALQLIDRRGWHEAALYDETRGVLVVGEALGTSRFFCTPGERLGVHALLRLRPPRSLTDLQPDHVLVGHGGGIHEDASTTLSAAIERARRGLPRLALQNARLLSPI